MPSNRVAAAASAVTLTLTTNIIVVTVTPAAPNNQVAAPITGVLVRAEVIITGAASATNATVAIVRGSSAGGTSILPTNVVQPVTTGATDTTIVCSAIETVANFNAALGIYSLQVNQAGAATTARIATIEIQPLAAGV
jgi:hypothetical protein